MNFGSGALTIYKLKEQVLYLP